MRRGWQTKKLGQVCVVDKCQGIHKGLPYVGLEHIESHTGRFIGSTEPVAVKSSTFKFSQEHVLYGRLRPYLNKVMLPNFTGHCSTEIFPLKPLKNLSRKFLQYWFLSDATVEKIDATSTGARMPRANMNKVIECEFPLPPLPEQERVVKILNEAFEGIATAKANTEKNLQNAQELFKSYLQNIFSNPAEDWEEKKLGEIGKVSMCKRVFKDQTTTAGDIPFYKIGTFGKEPDAYISKEIYDKFLEKFSFPKKGDILISASGTIGRCVKYDGEPAYFQDSNIVWIDNDEKQVLNDYLYHFYRACNWSSTKGATISRLYNDNLKQIKIAFHKSLAEQRAIVAKFDALATETKKLEAIYHKKMADLEELKKSVLHSAFNGELTGVCS